MSDSVIKAYLLQSKTGADVFVLLTRQEHRFNWVPQAFLDHASGKTLA